MSTRKGEDSINYQFKLLYTIGIILIVSNHCENGGISLFYELFPAYSFHVALFVFCSGYFYKEKAECNICGYVVKKIKSLILPLYIWNFIYTIISYVLFIKGFEYGENISVFKIFVEPIITGHQYLVFSPTWFVFPLFFTEVFNVIIRRLISVLNIEIKEIVYILIVLILGMSGIYMSSRGYNSGWYLVVTRVLYFLPFYMLGYIYKIKLEKIDIISDFWYFLAVIGITLAIIIYNGGVLKYEQAWSKYDEFSCLPYVVGVLGIAFWLRVSRNLTPLLGKNKWVNYIANNTYTIMANHFFGFWLVKTFFAIGYRYTDFLFQDFRWDEYHRSIWYYYLPKELEQTRIIYTFVGIMFSLLIQKFIDIAKARLCTKD